MTVFMHPERAGEPLLAAAFKKARPALADGVWVRDARHRPVLAVDSGGCATGVLVEVGEAVLPLLDLYWGTTGVVRRELRVTAALRVVGATAWALPSVRDARLLGYRVPRGVHG